MNVKIKHDTRQFVSQAWTRNGEHGVITGEALIVACLMHTTGTDRAGSDFKAVQSLMNDLNYEGE